jgi:hypothetical protein
MLSSCSHTTRNSGVIKQLFGTDLNNENKEVNDSVAFRNVLNRFTKSKCSKTNEVDNNLFTQPK